MKIKPNKTILEGRVRRVEKAPDGWGSNLEIAVEKSTPADGFSDFLQAQPGSTVSVFAADSEGVEEGGSYKLTASVSGGPRGERVILESAAPTIAKPGRGKSLGSKSTTGKSTTGKPAKSRSSKTPPKKA